MIVDNWEILDDPILPPTESSWFGSIPQIKAIEASPGWAYATDDPVGHFGDADRIYPVSALLGATHLAPSADGRFRRDAVRDRR